MKTRSLIQKVCSLLLVFGLVTLWSGTPILAAMGALDGKAFVGEMGENGKKSGDKDTLVFNEGKFRSTACDPYGFGGANYSATVTGDATMFEATTVSPTDGMMIWKGTVKGGTLEGNATWNKPGKAPVEYWVKAELKK